MDPVSIGLLAALAGGVGGELGKDLWSQLRDLVQRPKNGDASASPSAEMTTLAELAAVPDDIARAQALSSALALRADADPDFLAELSRWNEQAKPLAPQEDGPTSPKVETVHNEIHGRPNFHAPVVQTGVATVSFITPSGPIEAAEACTES